ncbi:MAG: hypothetical protein JWM21_4308 [Acidobacteria bacterium]|nr:hypothetical protein [Acidobacteriota bacterium]
MKRILFQYESPMALLFLILMLSLPLATHGQSTQAQTSPKPPTQTTTEIKNQSTTETKNQSTTETKTQAPEAKKSSTPEIKDQAIPAPEKEATSKTNTETTSRTATESATKTTTETINSCPDGRLLAIRIQNPYKIKAAGTVTSSTARPDDYVEFTTMEDIYSIAEDGCKAQVLIPKGTSLFGFVELRKHRHFPLVDGKLTVRLRPYKAWDGETVDLSISRKNPRRNDCVPGTRKGKNLATPPENCIAGRANANVAALVPAAAAMGTAILAAVAKTTAGKILAATALFTIVAQQNVGDLLNGTDAQINKDEVFDVEIVKPVKIPAPLGSSKP